VAYMMTSLEETADPLIGIKHVSTWLPEGRIDNRSRMQQFNVDENFLIRRTGMMRLALKDPGDDTSDLCVNAFNTLQMESGLNPQDVDCLIVCTQNPDDYGLPHTSAIVHGKLGLGQHCACFDVSLGCSGYIYGLSVIQGFMQVNGYRNGVLITADPYSKVIDPADKNTSLLFGDGSTATLLSHLPVWEIGRAVFGTQGDQGKAIRVRKEDRRFEMAGRAVVEFCSTIIPANIHATLQKNGLEIGQIDRFLAHQGSRYIVDLITRKMGLGADKVPFSSADYGNTVSSSIPMLLAAEAQADTVLLTGFGVGLSWGSIVLRRRNEPTK
jgi:3-oxoacyl-[acyl-carrier-protein] synthase-3